MPDLKSLSDADFLATLRSGGRAAVSVAEPAVTQAEPAQNIDYGDFAPLSTQALDEANAAAQHSVFAAHITPPGASEGARPNVAMTEEPLPFTQRTALSARRRPIDKYNYLKAKYGGENIEVNEAGDFIVRNQKDSETGSARDILVPAQEGLSLPSLVASSPELIGGILGGLAFRGKAPGTSSMFQRLSRTLGNLGLMAAGTETAGALKDAAVRAVDGEPAEIGEIAKERAKDAVFDFGIGTGLGAMAKTGGFLISPFASSAAKTAEEQAAVKALSAMAGEEMPQTLGELTRSKLLLRAESMFSRLPGSSVAFDAINAAKDKFIRGLQNRFLGIPQKTPPREVAGLLPSQQATGEQALGALAKEARGLESAVAGAKETVERTGTAEAQKLAGITLPSTVNTYDLGGTTRDVVKGSFDAFKDTMRQQYGDFLGRPELTQRIIPTDKLAAEAASFGKQLPSVLKEIKVQALDQYGNPTEATKEVLERLDEFVAPKVRSFTDRLASLTSGKTSINDLKQLRTGIDDAIAEGVAIPGTDTSQLMKLREMVSESIRDGLENLPDGKNLVKQWDTLNQTYATGIDRFNRNSIRQILVKEGEPGALGNTALIERTFGKGAGANDVYQEYRRFFGPQSAEFKNIQNAIADEAIGKGALRPGTQVIEGKRLLSNLEGMRQEVREEILGVNEAELRRIGEALAVSQGKLDINELAQLAKSKSLTAAKLKDLIAAEGKRADEYKNRIMEAASKGLEGRFGIQPAEFVRYMISPAVSEPEIASVLGKLSHQPDLVQAIRTLAGEEFLSQAGTGIELSSKNIANAFADRNQQSKWLTLLGKETYDGLKNFETALHLAGEQAGAYKTLGSLSLGQQLGALFGRGELTAIPAIVTRMIGSFVYTGPGRLLANRLVTPEDTHRFVNGMIASEPFLNYLTGRLGTDNARAAVDALRERMDDVYKKEHQKQGDMLAPGQRVNLRNLSDEEFLRRLRKEP